MGPSTIAMCLFFGTNALLFVLFYVTKLFSLREAVPSLHAHSHDHEGSEHLELTEISHSAAGKLRAADDAPPTALTASGDVAIARAASGESNKKSDVATQQRQVQPKPHVEKELSKPFIGTLTCFYNLTAELFRTGCVMALTYICENYWIFEHSSKSYSRDLFLFVCILFFMYGIYTRKQVTDLTLLSREQTEEWKGWMQFVFLLYHYFHAEEVYNSVRVMITCYVWVSFAAFCV
jgi:hypothetical protein